MSSVWIPQIRVEIGLSGPTVGPLIWHIGDATARQDRHRADRRRRRLVGHHRYVRNWSFRRGASRSDGMNLRYEAGTLSVELNNGDRRFDPTNLSGPYVSGGVSELTPMVRVRLTAIWAGIAYR
jgi:hypothetical protein